MNRILDWLESHNDPQNPWLRVLKHFARTTWKVGMATGVSGAMLEVADLLVGNPTEGIVLVRLVITILHLQGTVPMPVG